MNMKFCQRVLAVLFSVGTVLIQSPVKAQGLQWAADGYHYYRAVNGEIAELDIRDAAKKNVLVDRAALTPAGKPAIAVRRFFFSDDRQKVLINTNTRRVWRQDTRATIGYTTSKPKHLPNWAKASLKHRSCLPKYRPMVPRLLT
jgi:dipeptidyl-peptidase-4